MFKKQVPRVPGYGILGTRYPGYSWILDTRYPDKRILGTRYPGYRILGTVLGHFVSVGE